MNNSEIHDLKIKCARYESQIDHLETELRVLDKMLTDFGFEEGIKTIKESITEILEQSSA